MRTFWAKYWCYRQADSRAVDGKGPGTWRRFSLRELHSATNHFNYDNKLGEGAIGSVYWGQLASGDQIAVKRLKVCSAKAEMEFAVEIEILGRVRHKNLLSLLGYCAEGEERLIVYDYMPNLSLVAHLHGHLAAASTLDWDQRMKIAVGSAEGLAYLHHYATPHIIHRDIKASNILLDDKLHPLVADFGLTRIISEGSTHKGISGYSAPQIVSGKVSETCDVFSFGVLMIELISGKKPIERVSGGKQAIMHWARPLVSQGRFHDLVDAKLEGKFHKGELTRLVQVAALCTEIIPEERPSMQDVVEMLKQATKGTVKLPIQLARDGLRLDEPVLCSTHPVRSDVNTICVSAKPV